MTERRNTPKVGMWCFVLINRVLLNFLCIWFNATALKLNQSRTNMATPMLIIVQELCESRGGRPELSVLTSLLVSVDVKNY